MENTDIQRLAIIFLSILLWGVFIFIPVFVPDSVYNNSHEAFSHTAYFLNRIVFIAFFYLNYFILIPRILHRNKFIYAFLFILLLFFIPTICFVIRYFTASFYGLSIPLHQIFFALRMIPIVFGVLITSFGLRLFFDWMSSQRRKKEMEQEKIKSELAVLKMQVNPHFLFNTLNNIKSLIRKKSEDSEDAVVKLSQMMRYMMQDASIEKVSLEREIEYLENYVDLQKIRLSSSANVVFNVDGYSENCMIAPMLLIPFVENAFKHGLSSKGECNIIIKPNVVNGILFFNIVNSVYPDSTKSLEESNGIGIKNVKNRLDLIYPEKYELSINHGKTDFEVNLRLPVN